MMNENTRGRTRQRQSAKFGVIGLGRFGEVLVKALLEQGVGVLAIDRDARVVQRLSSDIPSVILDATDEESLRKVDITDYDAVVVTIGTDFESNVLTVAALKALGVPHVISRVAEASQRETLLRVGADRVVLLEAEAGRRLAREIITPGNQEQMPLGNMHHITALEVHSSLVGHSLANLRSKGVLDEALETVVLAIQRGDESLVWPPADTVLVEGDWLVILQGKDANIDLDAIS
jgi:trk system potassium uptake protein TrkA